MNLNPGTGLDLARVRAVRVNQPAVVRRTTSLAARRSVKKDYQAAWLVKAVQCMDLTTLAGDDTPGRVHRLCAKARNPLRADLLAALGLPSLQVGAVCVYHEMVAPAVAQLAGSGIPVAVVSTGFPAGLTPHETKLREIEMSVAAGALEVDIVISRRHGLTHDWQAMYDEVKAFREACGPKAHLKAILATGELQTLENVARASWVCMMAGADFIKTSTGKIAPAATLPVTLVMLEACRDWYDATGVRMGMKPAGGIRTTKDAMKYLVLVNETVGTDWLTPELFRLGASSVLNDLLMQRQKLRTGVYAGPDDVTLD